MARVRLEPWTSEDFPLLTALHGDPAMMEHLGGPETDEKRCNDWRFDLAA